MADNENDNRLRYTDDKVLVYTIFLSNLPNTMSVEDVQNYFRQFGKLSNVDLRLAERNGFVTFEDPLAAAIALQQEDHHISPNTPENIRVTAGKSWQQPTMLMDNIDEGSSLCLNDDCLVEICKYLESPKDHLYFALANSRFANVVQMCFKRFHRDYDKDKFDQWQLSLWQKREFFELFGSTIEELNIERNDPYMDFIKKYCNNIKSLVIKHPTVKSNIVPELIQLMPHISELTIKFSELEDKHVATINLPNLVKLSLYYNRHLKGEFLKRLSNVQHFDLHVCELEEAHLIQALQSMKHLKTLIMHDSSIYPSTKFYQEMSQCCHELEVLHISLEKYVRYDCLAQLPCLTKLLIEAYEVIELNQILQAFSAHKAQQLKVLIISCYYDCIPDDSLLEIAKLKCLEKLSISNLNCRNMPHDGLLTVLGECKELREFDIKNSKFTNAFIHQAIDTLNRSTAQSPVLINMTNSLIEETIFQDTKYIAAASQQLLTLALKSG